MDIMDIKKKIGQRIRRLRIMMKLSQGELAERSGLGIETISRMERGVQGLTLDNLYKISKGMNISLKELIDIDKKEEELYEDMITKEIFSILNDSSFTIKLFILETLKLMKRLQI